MKLSVKIPSWMPKAYVNLIREQGSKPLKFSLSFAEKRILRKLKSMKTSDWAEKYRYVSESEMKGPWKNIVTPYLVDIMDAADYECVQTVILCKCVQSGGSEAVHNCIGKRTDREPGPVRYVYPNESSAKKQLRTRVIPMFKESPRLRRLMTGAVNDETNLGLSLKHTSISIGWAHSPTSLASDPIRYIVFDETDKYPSAASKTESDPISLGEKRTTTYKRRGKAKIWKLSTPSVETGPIWQALNTEAQVIFDFYAKCPHCGQHQVMVFEQIKWPEGGEADPETVESKLLAWYECQFCQAKWDDEVRNRAVRAGEWRSRGKFNLTVPAYMQAYAPKKVGFLLPAWISFFVSLSESAAAFLRGQKDRMKLRDFKNNYAAEPWKNVVVTADYSDILQCCVPLARHTVPAKAVALTAGIDVQKHGFWFVVRAWATDYTSWLVDYGYLESWADVDHLLFEKKYPVEGTGHVSGIWRAAIDTGGGKYSSRISSTEETYLWLQSRMGYGMGCRVWGVKGSSNPLASKMRIGTPLNKTPSGKALRAGMRNILLDTDKLKDMFFQRLEKAMEGLPGGAFLNSDTDESYAKQILAEEKQTDERGVEKWVKKTGSAANHYLDCECMASIVADWEWPGGGVNLLQQPEQEVVVRKKEVVENPFTGGGDFWS